MIFKIFLNYIFGFLNIKVEGFFIERFINICISKRILLWNLKRNKSTILYARVGIQDYKKLRNVCKKTKTRVEIQKKVGLPFILHKYRKRKIFGILLILVIIGLVVMSNFIWNIEINGNINITEEELMKSLEESGLTTGLSKTDIDTTKIINKIRLNRDDIAWIGITIKGTNALVEIKETDKAPKVIDKNEYCNIISDKTGIITKISVQNGTALVKVGDIVNPGTQMVGGYIEGTYTGTRYVHSIADIEAKVWYSKKNIVNYNQEIKVPTGNTETKYSLEIKNFNINFFKSLSKFQKYDTIYEDKKIKLFSDFYLPIKVTKRLNNEYNLETVTYTTKELIENTIPELEEELKQEITDINNIVNKQVNTYEYEDYMEIELIYEVIETIGIEEKI